MPSIRDGRPRAGPSLPRQGRRVVLVVFAAAALLAALLAALWPRAATDPAATSAPTSREPVPTDATPRTDPADAAPAAPPPTILGLGTSSPSSPGAPLAATTTPRPAPNEPTPRVRRFSLRGAVREHEAKSPAPDPGATLCTLRPNTILGLLRTTSITSQLGEFETYHHANRACGRSLDIAIERTGSGILVNGFSYDYRAACVDFSTTIIEIDETPDRSYLAWILPQGGEITACPDSQPLSKLSRAKRTPRQPSSRSPRTTGPPTPAGSPSSWTATGASSSGEWSGSPEQR